MGNQSHILTTSGCSGEPGDCRIHKSELLRDTADVLKRADILQARAAAEAQIATSLQHPVAIGSHGWWMWASY